ncbi:MAG TPA: hypothetical protein VMB79_00385 [Jatrophihabitans sp.]|nr:hypothetical protein [Jatrophihabitans sp.]
MTTRLLVLFQVKTRIEEAALGRRFPGYRAYAATTGRPLPRPRGGCAERSHR